jgi:SAM-dependent methyltransferase
LPTAPLEILQKSLLDGYCALLVLSRKIRQSVEPCDKISIRPVVVQRHRMYQLTLHHADKVTHENLSPPDTAARVMKLFGSVFLDATLYASEGDFSFRSLPNGTIHLSRKPPTKSATAGSGSTHNRAKGHLIPEGIPCPFLIEIGVMTPEGKVRQSMTRKFRQINRFLEFVEDIVPALESHSDRELRVVDFGCGKSYLTFAIHHLLTQIHRRKVRIIGLDRKLDVMRHCSEIAERLQCRGLEFRHGDISAHQETERIDLAVSLHACDTATDDALLQAIHWQSQVILAVPCCQHELARQIHNPDWSPLLRHGILKEHLSSLATDSLRALALEARGYATQVMEFIDLEHTAKNLLIRAVRRPPTNDGKDIARREEYQAFRRLLGIESTAVDRLLD